MNLNGKKTIMHKTGHKQKQQPERGADQKYNTQSRTKLTKQDKQELVADSECEDTNSLKQEMALFSFQIKFI